VRSRFRISRLSIERRATDSREACERSIRIRAFLFLRLQRLPPSKGPARSPEVCASGAKRPRVRTQFTAGANWTLISRCLGTGARLLAVIPENPPIDNLLNHSEVHRVRCPSPPPLPKYESPSIGGSVRASRRPPGTQMERGEAAASAAATAANETTYLLYSFNYLMNPLSSYREHIHSANGALLSHPIFGRLRLYWEADDAEMTERRRPQFQRCPIEPGTHLTVSSSPASTCMRQLLCQMTNQTD
jgi:hypothetical protein